jgi:hypothetical protein
MPSQQVQVPPRCARVNAWVISRDTDAKVRFLTAVFGAVETPGSRMLDPDTRLRLRAHIAKFPRASYSP